MNSVEFSSLLNKKKILISDGATGTNLMQRGLERGSSAEQWVLDHPEQIIQLHEDFIDAGSDIILTCTFGASKIRLAQSGLEDRFEEINATAVALAKRAAGEKGILVAGSMGPLGHMMKPFGDIEAEQAVEQYSKQAEILTKTGVDLIVIETQFDLNEAAAAIDGVRSRSDIALVCSLSFDRGNKTMMGVGPTAFAEAMEDFNLSALGINCGKSLDDNLQTLKELSELTDLPIWFKPNAGLPTLDTSGNAAYDVSPEQMGSFVQEWITAGASIIGGCCGTSPDHLKAIAKACKSFLK